MAVKTERKRDWLKISRPANLGFTRAPVRRLPLETLSVSAVLVLRQRFGTASTTVLRMNQHISASGSRACIIVIIMDLYSAYYKAVMLILVLVLKDSLRTKFKSLSLSCPCKSSPCPCPGSCIGLVLVLVLVLAGPVLDKSYSLI